MNTKFNTIFFSLLLVTIFSVRNVSAESCMYLNKDGAITSVKSKDQIPPEFINSAKCFKNNEKPNDKEPWMAPPDKVSLEGGIRKTTVSSPLGRAEVRWAREAERLFGRTPERAVKDALITVSKAIKRGKFPVEIDPSKFNWQIVFMDEKVPESEIPLQLVDNCHPAWMTPPSNIYVVAQRVVAGCSGTAMNIEKADQQLTTILLHEFGHVIEYLMLLNKVPSERIRAEGFATWFQSYAAEFSTILPSGEERDTQIKDIQRMLQMIRGRQPFIGSHEDYLRASLPFHVAFNERGAKGVLSIYSELLKKPRGIDEIIKDVFGLSGEKWNEAVSNL